MNEKFNNKYRIESARLQTWDYSWNAAYFITICLKNRKHLFGEIVDNKMHYSHAGIIADVMWHEIKNHFANVVLGAFQVMPNHLHGIIILNNVPVIPVETGHALSPIPNKNALSPNENNQPTQLETGHALSLPQPLNNQTPGQKRFQNIGKNTISSIVGSYKSAVTKHINRLNINFEWQTLFHDHIIRDEKSFNNITNYIINNPFNWKEDKFFI